MNVNTESIFKSESRILRAYRYLYFRIYSWNLRVWGESDLPQLNALFGVSFLICLNVLSLITLTEVVTRTNLFATATTKGVLFAIYAALICYTKLFSMRKYQEVGLSLLR